MNVDLDVKEDEIITSVVEENIGIKEKSNTKKAIEKFIKRTVDIIAGIVGVILLIPLTIAIFIARKILKEDDGPIFYTQLRIGKNGKHFRMYKYRSMVINADEILEKYLEENEDAKEEYKKNKKLKNDPRVTKLGAFLRKTSLDEMPQFINVLKGEMSLVGPRPYLPREKDDMGTYYEKIISEKPGITGPWQVSGRSETTFKDRLLIDVDYCNYNSLSINLKLLLKTISKVLKKEGAL